MEGGIAVILLGVIVVVVAIVGVAMYLTGGTLWARKTSRQGDRVEGGGESGAHRPTHKTASSPTIENTEVVGAAKVRERDG